MPKKSQFEKFNVSGVKCLVKCVDVYDGDTITLEVDFRDVIKKFYQDLDLSTFERKNIYLACRMAGYNSAEVSRCSDEEKSKGLEAKQFMTELVLNKQLYCHFLAKKEGKLIKLKNNDPYGRPIIDLYTVTYSNEPDIYVNQVMLDAGHAALYDGHGKKQY